MKSPSPDLGSLPAGFYARPVLEVARELIGCTVTHGETAGVIVETEAYHESEPACHAFIGVTPRTSTLFGPPGRAYVYHSYGVHALLNAVCEPEGVAAAVLIRALHPTAGLEAMAHRRGVEPVLDSGSFDRAAEELCSGPGKLTQALRIRLGENGRDLAVGPIVITPRTGEWQRPEIVAGTRIGINRAVGLPWRFCAAGSAHVSRPRPWRRVRA
jgi:DNA-3-methyladenine glycosylase